MSPDDEDTFIPDRETRRICGGVSAMTIWRWERNPDLEFPKAVKINGRKYRNKPRLLSWWARRAAE
jgi:predicted DNA-binding transcriptional regulator AlpA